MCWRRWRRRRRRKIHNGKFQMWCRMAFIYFESLFYFCSSKCFFFNFVNIWTPHITVNPFWFIWFVHNRLHFDLFYFFHLFLSLHFIPLRQTLYHPFIYSLSFTLLFSNRSNGIQFQFFILKIPEKTDRTAQTGITYVFENQFFGMCVCACIRPMPKWKTNR